MHAFLLVIRSQFSNSDGEPVCIIELCIDADPVPPRPAAEQHHLVDRGGDCNRGPARSIRTKKKKRGDKIKKNDNKCEVILL